MWIFNQLFLSVKSGTAWITVYQWRFSKFRIRTAIFWHIIHFKIYVIQIYSFQLSNILTSTSLPLFLYVFILFSLAGIFILFLLLLFYIFFLNWWRSFFLGDVLQRRSYWNNLEKIVTNICTFINSDLIW